MLPKDLAMAICSTMRIMMIAGSSGATSPISVVSTLGTPAWLKPVFVSAIFGEADLHFTHPYRCVQRCETSDVLWELYDLLES
jgi:hypothetical protein